MPVNLDIKGMLAKCLAMEDIIVEHRKVETACFNVHTRCLTLPLWEKASNDVYTMLVLHEISHSLFTPNEDWSQNTKVPQQFVNVVEDVRVEKLCKRKYPGSPKSFFNGYKELAEQDFFSVADEDISALNLADRANLHFKIGNFLDLDFSPEEQEIISLIGDAETFADTLVAAEELYKYCKQKEQEQTKINLDSHENQTQGSGSGNGDSDSDSQEEQESDGNTSDSDQESNESQSTNNQQSTEDSPNQSDSQSTTGGERSQSDPQVKTMQSLEDALKNLVSTNPYENDYVEIPKLNLKHIIVNNAEIHDKCKVYWDEFIERNGCTQDEIFGVVDADYLKFKRSAQKEVNYLVKEFECRKAADSYARSTTARTGILDCTKLHTYKFNEDLFKKVSVIPNGKNHGLIFILDWSGSMGNVLLDTVKQLFNLVWFCKKVSIPFEVYAFTNDYPSKNIDLTTGRVLPAYDRKVGVFCVEGFFSLLNLVTSKTNSKVLEEQMKNIYRLANHYSRSVYTSYSVPHGLTLSGTPLNETLVALHQILPQFQSQNKLQKVQCVILTDGEGGPLKFHKEFHRKWEPEPFVGTSNVSGSTVLRDRKTGHTYNFDGNYQKFTDILLQNLRDNFADVNFIGIRVLECRDAGNFIRNYTGYYGKEYETLMTSWRKEKSFAIKSSGYHSYFGLSSSILDSDTEFSVAECASKSQIKSAFVKSLKNKKLNKKVLGDFIDLVA